MSVSAPDTVRIIPRPEIGPGYCIASMKDEDPLGFIDTLLTPPVVDPRVYISVSWIKEMAQKLGFHDPEQAERLRELELRAAELETDLDLERRNNDSVRKEIEGIYALKRVGWSEAQKPGRPKSA